MKDIKYIYQKKIELYDYIKEAAYYASKALNSDDNKKQSEFFDNFTNLLDKEIQLGINYIGSIELYSAIYNVQHRKSK